MRRYLVRSVYCAAMTSVFLIPLQEAGAHSPVPYALYVARCTDRVPQWLRTAVTDRDPTRLRVLAQQLTQESRGRLQYAVGTLTQPPVERPRCNRGPDSCPTVVDGQFAVWGCQSSIYPRQVPNRPIFAGWVHVGTGRNQCEAQKIKTSFEQRFPGARAVITSGPPPRQPCPTRPIVSPAQ